MHIEFPLSDREAVKLLSPTRRSPAERALLIKLIQAVGNDRLCLQMLHLAFNATSLDVSGFVAYAQNRVDSAKVKFPGNAHEQKQLACIDMAVETLDENLRALVSGLWIWRTYFWPELATAVLLPNYEYIDGKPSPVDDSLRELCVYGFIIEKRWWSSPVRMELHSVPTPIRRYSEIYVEPAIPHDKLAAQFLAVCMTAVQTIAPDVSLKLETQLLARCTSGNLLHAAKTSEGALDANYLLHCARIAFILGDTTLADELLRQGRRRAEEERPKLTAEAARTAMMGFYYANMHQVFLGKPRSPQEEFDQAIIPAAERLCELHILRKVFVQRYEPLIQIPDFVSSLQRLTPIAPAHNSALEQTEELCRVALRVLRKGGYVAEFGLFSFGLACVYARHRKFTQAHTQFENTKNNTYKSWDNELQAAFRHERACLYYALGELDKACEEMSKASNYYQVDGNFHRLSATCLAEGVLAFLRTRNSKFATHCIEIAIDTLNESSLSHNAYGQTVEEMDLLRKKLIT